MKKYPIIILALALSLATTAAQEINVSGTADVLVVPDEVLIHVGVETRNENLDQARRQHDERMKKVLTFIKTSAVPDKDVQTDFINLYPEYGNDWGRTKPPVYVVRKFIEIRLTNITSLESVLTGLLDAGVDRINNVEFRTTQLRKYRDQARAMAIHAAKEKADALCSELDVKRGKPLHINASESGGSWNPYGYMGSQGYGANVSNSQVMIQNSDSPSDSPGGTLSLGQVKVSATVNVSFAIQ
jgi:uncharacterized protein YggE